MSDLFGLGMFKTGTTSLAQILGQVMHAGHEGDIFPALEMVEGLAQGQRDPAAVYRYLSERRQRLGLEADISGFLYPFAPYLLRHYPKARFIITVRPCGEWVRSCLQHLRVFQQKPDTSRIMAITKAVGTDPARWPEWDEAAQGEPLSVTKLARMWRDVNNFLLTTIPPARRLVLHTDELAGDLARLEAFLSLSPGRLQACWKNKAAAVESLEDFFTIAERRLLQHEAGELMAKLFPSGTAAADLRSPAIRI
jgi:hypothetical protein